MDDVQFSEGVIDNGRFGTRTIRFETGRLARQAQGSVVAYLDGETMLLSSTSVGKQPKEDCDFFPLTVDVEERSYAAGKIPGSYFRREGRPSTEAILACRLIDRPLRPSFNAGLRNEVQVIVTVLSIAPGEFYEALAINAASASTLVSGLPFSGPIGGVRLALIDGQWVAFPRYEDLSGAVFDLTVAGRVFVNESGKEDIAIMMVEAEATESAWDLIHSHGAKKPNEEVIEEGIESAKVFIRTLCDIQRDLASKLSLSHTEPDLYPDYSDSVYSFVEGLVKSDLEKVYRGNHDSGYAPNALSASDEIKQKAYDAFHDAVLSGRFDQDSLSQFPHAYKAILKDVVRTCVLEGFARMDGRGLSDIRPLDAEVQVVPRVHGSAVFQRGETQVLGVTTLNMLKMEQQIDSLAPIVSKRYIHHYNFPPYSTGEVGRVGSPKRREIGHGFLAERALVPVLPSREDFPYAIRQVSEALGSNGSTSMGSVCASTLSLLNAGVPLRAPVAGIAMGLISGRVDGEMRYVTLTDISGSEDALGDMDFKVAGTSDFITALQLDTKLDGIPAHVLSEALAHARSARLAILDVLTRVIDSPDQMSEYAPRVVRVKIPVQKIGELIGPKGKVINSIQDETGAEISIEDDGTVYIGSSQADSSEKAVAMVNSIVNPVEPCVGSQFLGTVVKNMPFGSFISLVPGKDGLLHISEIRKMVDGRHLESVDEVLSVGQKVLVEVSKIDDRGKLCLVAVK